MEKQKDSKIPEIRFQGFDGEWKEKPIGEIFSEIKRPVVLEDNQLYELITVKRRNGGVVSRGHLLGRDILVKNYSQLQTGDFVISKRQVVHGATGIVPDKLDEAIVSNEYLVAIGNPQISSEFLALLSSLPDMKRKFFLSSYGVDIEKLFFDANDWKKRTAIIPCGSEQALINRYFKALDRMITFHQYKHKKLLILKQSMLKKMFPRGGSTRPEIRFSGFCDDWELKRLGDIGNTYSGLSGKTKEDFGHGTGQYVTYMGVFLNALSDENWVEAIDEDNKQNQVQFGDVLFTTSSETPEEVGMASVWLGSSENTYLNSFCFGFRPAVEMDPYFLAYILRAEQFRNSITFLAQGISRFNISKRKTMNLSIMCPQLREQQKIGAYFQNIDMLISRHSIQVEKLKQIKLACYEKMFV